MPPPPIMDDSAASLLPRNATKLEFDLLRTERFDWLDGFADRVGTAKFPDRPDNFLIWLLVEYNLVRFMEFIEDKRTLLKEGLEMRHIMGTEAAILKGSAWINYPLVEVEQYTVPNLHFPEWSLRLRSGKDQLDDDEDLCRMARLFSLLQPARSVFQRVYNNQWDQRKLVWSKGKWGLYYSGVSGVHPERIGFCKETHGMQVSLGRRHTYNDLEGWFDDPLDMVDFALFHIHLNEGVIKPKPWPVLDNDWYGSFYADQGKVYVLHAQLAQNSIIHEPDGPIITDGGDTLIYT